MSICLRKGLEKSTMYQEKNIEKHKHVFDLECILEITKKIQLLPQCTMVRKNIIRY